jgi:hypothetical protein
MSWYRFQRRLTRYYKLTTHPVVKQFGEIFRQVIHVREVDMNTRYRVNRRDPLTHNMDMRVEYIRGRLDENRFRVLIQQKNKKEEKNMEFYQVLDMYVTTMNDIFTNIYDYPDKNLHEFIQQCYTDIANLKEYVNRNLEEIGKMYKVAYPILE